MLTGATISPLVCEMNGMEWNKWQRERSFCLVCACVRATARTVGTFCVNLLEE